MTDIQMIMEMRREINKLQRENTDLSIRNCELTGQVGIFRNRVVKYNSVIERLEKFFESEMNRLHRLSEVEVHSTDTIKELMTYERIFEAYSNIWEDIINEYK